MSNSVRAKIKSLVRITIVQRNISNIVTALEMSIIPATRVTLLDEFLGDKQSVIVLFCEKVRL